MGIKVSAAAPSMNRLAATRLTWLTLRYMENWDRLVEGYDEAMIVVAVAAISTERMTRRPLSEEELNLANRLPRERYSKCTIQAIAQATGLNRETARRKINKLIERGVLEKTQSGSIMFRPGFQQRPFVSQLISAQLEVFRRTADALVRDGILEITQ